MIKKFLPFIFLLIAVFIPAADISKSGVTLKNQTDVTLNKGYTYSRVFVLNEENFLFSHNSKSGLTSIWNLRKGGAPVYEQNWSTGWTNFDFYTFQGNVYFFHQKQNEGTAKIVRLDYKSIMQNNNMGDQLYKEKWSTGWSITKFFVHYNIIYFFHYKAGSGLARLNATSIGGDVGTKIYEKTWSKGYTNFDMIANKNNFFMLYQNGSEGTCVINKIDLKKLELAASVGLLTPNLGQESYREKWSTGWSNFSLFSTQGREYLFINKKEKGTARIEELTPEGTLGRRVYDSTWSSGWSETDVFYNRGRALLFHQKSSTGQTKISEIVIN